MADHAQAIDNLRKALWTLYPNAASIRICNPMESPDHDCEFITAQIETPRRDGMGGRTADFTYFISGGNIYDDASHTFICKAT